MSHELIKKPNEILKSVDNYYEGKIQRELMEGIQVGGLVSGLDTNSIIDGLTGIEENKVRRIISKQSKIEVKLNAFNDLKGKIGEFAAKAQSLEDIKAFNLYTSTSSDEEHVTVSGDENAVPGSFDIEVESLASQWKSATKSFASSTTQLGFTGTVEVSKSKDAIKNDPLETTVDLEIDVNDSLKDIVNKINALDGAGVSASLISLGENDNRIVISAVDDGTEGFFLKDIGGANVLDNTGLGIIDNRQKIKSDFNLRLNTVGAAQTTSQFSELFTGIGSNTGVDAGDEISVSGTDALGNTVSGTYTVGAASTIQDFLNEIQTIYQSQGASANVSLNASGEVVVLDDGTGNQSMTMNMSFTDVNSSGSQLALSGTGEQGWVQNNFTNILIEGKNAFFKIDGLSVSSTSNKDDKTVNGITFDFLKAEKDKVIQVDLNRDIDGVVGRIQEFVDQYNLVMKYIHDKTKVELKDKTDPNDKEEIESIGIFASDSTVYRIKNELRKIVTGAIQELGDNSSYTSLASIGITSDAKGLLTVDNDDVKDAIDDDFDGVRNLFINHGYSDNPAHSLGIFNVKTKTGTYSIDTTANTIDGNAATRTGDIITSTEGFSNGLTLEAPEGSGSGQFTFIRGIAGSINQYVDLANDQFDGFFSQSSKAFQDSIDRLQKRAEDMELKVEAFRSRLVRQFADLETSMGRLQQQSANFQAQLGGF